VTYVKICGCRSEADALVAAEAGADFVGFVFAESPRRISPDTARQIAEALGRTPVGGGGRLQSSRYPLPESWERLLATKRPLLVGVFEAQGAADVDSIAARAGIDIAQIHGAPSSLAAFSNRLPVIEAIDIDADPGADLDPSPSSLFLLDSSRGHGKRADWRLAAEIAGRLPVILAGGLTPENVAEAVRAVRPWGVDVSSGVETGGRKDAAKIRAFVAAAKGA
jgi:phosphoribosylanthranilate isomerase